MAKVVLCSEFGRGARFMAKLADCAVELRAQGHSVRLICADIRTAHYMEEFKKVSIFQAPQPERTRANNSKKTARQRNYSSVLMNHGYDKATTLTPVLRAWLHLLATLDADLVITDHSPTALLAGKLLMVPCVMIGSGYSVPPKQSPLPSLAPWKPNPAGEDEPDPSLIKEDEKLLSVVNQSIQELNFDKVRLKEAQEVYSHAAQWIMSLVEIDHYGKRDDASYVVRWSDSGASREPIWPNKPGDKIFVYMDAESAQLPVLLNQLRDRGDPVLAIVKNASDAFIDEHAADNVTVQREPVNIRQATDHCKVFISHCGHDLMYELLLLGVPSIMLPNNPENTLLAYRIARRKLGFPGPATADKLEVAKLIEKVNTSDQVWANASRISLKYENHDSLERLHDLISAKLPAA